jgi:hypothetical protein
MTRDLRPVWLLDIDGVLNAMSEAPNPQSLRMGTAKQKYLKTNSGTFRLRVNNYLVDFINRMHESELVEIRWCTTWSDEAVSVFAPAFGFPEFSVGARPGWESGRFDDYNWKPNAARGVIRDGRRLIWTDDEAIPEGFSEEIAPYSFGHLLIFPNEKVGLTLENCESIEKFILRSADEMKKPLGSLDKVSDSL